MTALDRVAGTLYGTALGDSMGMPVEMFSRKKIQADYGYIDRLMDGAADNPISCSLKAGEVTDDTIMSMLVCEMLKETGGRVEALLLIDKIRHWAQSDPKSRCVIGPSTRSAFEKIDAGMSIAKAGQNGVTNGASMKIAPIGIITPPDDEALLLERVHQMCMPTHNTTVAVSGAMAVAGWVSMAIQGEADVNKLFDFALHCAYMGETRGYDRLSPSVAQRMLLVRQRIYDFPSEDAASQWVYDVIGSGLPIAQTVPAAFAMLLLANADPLRCALLCANLGGDTDTLGAMACAMAGAIKGKTSIPGYLLSQLKDACIQDIDPTAEQLLALRG